MADLTIANLTAAGALTATDPVPVEQAGAAKRTTVKGMLEADVQAVPKVDGVKFPATQVLSADPNTLDDYEEGTWTGGMTCGTSGTIALYSGWQTGKYIKIGSSVTVTGFFRAETVSSPVGELSITGLPFANGANSENRAAVALYPLTLNAGVISSIFGLINSSTTAIIASKLAAGAAAALAGDIAADSGLYINVTYSIN